MQVICQLQLCFLCFFNRNQVVDNCLKNSQLYRTGQKVKVFISLLGKNVYT